MAYKVVRLRQAEPEGFKRTELKGGFIERYSRREAAEIGCKLVGDCTCLCARSGKGIQPTVCRKVRSRPSGAYRIRVQLRTVYGRNAPFLRPVHIIHRCSRISSRVGWKSHISDYIRDISLLRDGLPKALVQQQVEAGSQGPIAEGAVGRPQGILN